jgi:hypothetical protein
MSVSVHDPDYSLRAVRCQQVGFDLQAGGTDGTFSCKDFTCDHAGEGYHCPGGKVITQPERVNDGATMLYFASERDCDRCSLKSRPPRSFGRIEIILLGIQHRRQCA